MKMARLEINLLGPFQVSLDGNPVSGFDSDKVRGLLAYLTVEADQPHRRERLAGLLWPDYPERSARTNLRSALANLRKVIGDQQAQPPFLLITHRTIQFNRVSDSQLDVHQFTALVGGEPGISTDTSQLESAVARYKGEFLEGFFIPDSSTFEEWAQVTRQSFQRQMLSALHRLAACYLEEGKFEQALSYAQRQIELDSFQEAAHQQVMSVLAKSGQRNEAIRHYDGYRELLKAELGVEPLEITQVMYQQLLEDEPPGLPTTAVILRRVPKTVGECPYRGLAAFSEADAQFFYGREAFIGQMIEVVKKGSLVAVILGSS
jgi:DNA-binding SARP family transcriptional activator